MTTICISYIGSTETMIFLLLFHASFSFIIAGNGFGGGRFGYELFCGLSLFLLGRIRIGYGFSNLCFIAHPLFLACSILGCGCT